MNVYIWSYVEECTDNYHSGGGVVAFAKTEERAREMATEAGCNIHATEVPTVRKTQGKECIYIFPDAGCC